MTAPNHVSRIVIRDAEGNDCIEVDRYGNDPHAIRINSLRVDEHTDRTILSFAEARAVAWAIDSLTGYDGDAF